MRTARLSRRGWLEAGAALLVMLAFPASAADPGGREERDALENTRRREAIERCAGCHPKSYAAWKAGPHAHTYDKFPGNPAVKTECLRCHSPNRNVYDRSISSDWSGKGRLKSKKLLQKPDEPVITTGVDCLTCHVEGDRVVTRADYQPTPGLQPPPGFCNPKPAKSFSHVAGCITCHEPVLKTCAAYFEPDPAKRKAPFLACGACHTGDESDGRRGHYFYWDSGPGEAAKKEAVLTRPLLERIALEIRGEAARRTLALRWPTDSIPHPIIPETPRVFIVTAEALAEDGSPLLAKTVRFYSHEVGMDDLVEAYLEQRRKISPDEEFVDLGPRALFERTYEIPAGAAAPAALRLTVRRSSRFFPDDRYSYPLFVRETKPGAP